MYTIHITGANIHISKAEPGECKALLDEFVASHDPVPHNSR